MTDLIGLRDQLEQQLQFLPKEHRIAMRKIFDGIEEQRAEIERLNDLVALQKKDMKVAMDEIERLTDERLCRCADEVRCEMQTEIERLRAALKEAAKSLAEDEQEIERLNCALTISRGKHENAIREIERLQAVVDGLCDMLEEVGVDSHSALAALETDDEKVV